MIKIAKIWVCVSVICLLAGLIITLLGLNGVWLTLGIDPLMLSIMPFLITPAILGLIAGSIWAMLQ